MKTAHKVPAMGGSMASGMVYRGPCDAVEPELAPELPAHALPTRQLWAARDADGCLCLYPSCPDWDGEQFVPSQPEQTACLLPDDWFPELEAGFCQAFVRQGPRVDKRSHPQ